MKATRSKPRKRARRSSLKIVHRKIFRALIAPGIFLVR